MDIAKDWAEILPESGNMLIKRYDLINNSQLLIRSFLLCFIIFLFIITRRHSCMFFENPAKVHRIVVSYSFGYPSHTVIGIVKHIHSTRDSEGDNILHRSRFCNLLKTLCKPMRCYIMLLRIVFNHDVLIIVLIEIMRGVVNDCQHLCANFVFFSQIPVNCQRNVL